MRHRPRLTYNGLTVILSNPSRFDQATLLSGYAGKIFNDGLAPETNRYQCDIMTMDQYTSGSLLPGTKMLLLLGEGCLRLIPNNRRTISQQRGSPIVVDNLPAVASFFPQDCLDFQDWEKRFNAEQSKSTGDLDIDKEDEKNHGATKKENWIFWLQADVRKAVRLLKQPELLTSHPHYDTVIYPDADQLVNVLRSLKGGTLYLDIETDAALNITCFSFAFNHSTIYVVPFIRFNYTRCYSDIDTCRILVSLSRAMTDNTVCCHNSMFDLFVLAVKYRLYFGPKVYDTMLANHRCHPEVEKSLGHTISYWTYLPYHKDEGIFMPSNPAQEQALWAYNAKDVYGMILVREAIDRYAAAVPGLPESIAQANDSVRPYLITNLLGIRYDEQKRLSLVAKNDKAMMQCLRAMRLLIGEEAVRSLSARSKAGFIMSSQQCAEYFHAMMRYPVLKRSAKTNEPSVDEKVLQKMRLKYPDNLVLTFLLSYRGYKKTTGSLGFKCWASEPKF